MGNVYTTLLSLQFPIQIVDKTGFFGNKLNCPFTPELYYTKQERD